MRIFESHCHLDDRSYADDLDEVVQRARSGQVCAMMTVGTDGSSSGRAVVLADTYTDVYAAVIQGYSQKLLDQPKQGGGALLFRQR